MLKQLRISNLAILPELQVEFGEGLNVLSGETGAGKSILVDAIGLLAGKRASSEDVRSGADMAVVEGVLEFSADSPIWKELKDIGVPTEGNELILRRTVSSDGRSRAYANGWQWTVTGLSEFAARWIDISGQHGQQELLSEDHHARTLDEYGEHFETLDVFRSAYSGLREIDGRKRELEEQRAEATRQHDFLSFQFKELNDAKLRAGEEEELTIAHQRVANGERLAKTAENLEALLDGDEGLITLSGKLVSESRAGAKFDPTMAKWAEEAETAGARLGELSQQVSRYRHGLEFDPAEVDRIEGRLARLQSLARKYGSIERALAEHDRIQNLLALHEDFTARQEELEKEWSAAADVLVKAAQALTKLRKKTAKEFSVEVSRELKHLGMPNAQLDVRWDPPPSEGALTIRETVVGPSGAERIVFELAPNPGEGFKPLAKIASGGELSRVLLAIKGIALAGKASSETVYLFDEVDSGIGGETAERVGIRLQSLSRGRQVLCVTHLAQIACYANAHLCVEKRVKGGRTEAGVLHLDERGRKEELGRMMGGIEVTRKTLDHASELLRRGQETGTRALSR